MQHLLPWALASLSALLLGAALVLRLRQRQQSKARPLPTEWTLTPRPVFSTDERRVYRQLREALPHHIVLSKLPLVRFCQPTDPNEVRFWYELLGSTHVTFAVCSANGRVLAAIDLDSEKGGSRRTLQIKQSVLAACRVRYLRCAPDHLPSVPELQLLVPATGAAARGPQPAPTVAQARDVLASTVAARRRERTTLWQDSGFLQDSFFGLDGRADSTASSGFSGFGPLSGFGTPRSGVTVRELPVRGGPLPAVASEDVGGVVIDTPAVPLRH
jgi:hypothetical protein